MEFISIHQVGLIRGRSYHRILVESDFHPL